MAATSGIESVTVSTPGKEPVTFDGETWDRAMRVPQQLSFDVGGEQPRPTGASLAITGKGEIRSQLFMDDDVTVRIVDAAGEVVASFNGAVVDVAFKKHQETATQSAWVERIHKIKLEA